METGRLFPQMFLEPSSDGEDFFRVVSGFERQKEKPDEHEHTTDGVGKPHQSPSDLNAVLTTSPAPAAATAPEAYPRVAAVRPA